MNKLLLIITADTNDADYITRVSDVTTEELEILKPLFDKIKNFEPYKTQIKGKGMGWSHIHNWPVGEYGCREDLGEKTVQELYDLTDDDFEFAMEFIPYGEHGTHTITDIKVVEVINETKYI
jgi:hypothetical protein